MKARDLTGMTYGSLTVVRFDEDRHRVDVDKHKAGEIDRVRRYYICRCSKCGIESSIRGENLLSGNTKGCMCDANVRTGSTRHNNSLNKYEFVQSGNYWIGTSTNSDTKFIIDNDDYGFVSKYCWYETNHGYMMARIERDKQALLHRVIFERHKELKDGLFIDHINRVRTDCRMSNLRECTAQESAWNQGVSKNSQSGIRGVRYYKPTGKWNAYITIDGKFVSLGYYDNINDAIYARKNKENDLYGEFAPK